MVMRCTGDHPAGDCANPVHQLNEPILIALGINTELEGRR